VRSLSPKTVIIDENLDELFPEAAPTSKRKAMTAPAGKKRKNQSQRAKARRSLMQPQVPSNRHPFMPELQKWATHGCPVDCGPEWTWATIEQAVRRGPHQSATTAENIDLFQEDIAYQVKAGFCEILTWEEVQKIRPKHLKISPVAVVPQRNRRGRIILDLSFPVYPEGRGKQAPLQASVNESTKKQAPRGPVEELGNVVWRIMDLMDQCSNDDLHFQKIDLSDGFWRMIVEEEQKWNFCYVLPTPPGEPVQIVVPSALQMGWAESPGFFASATETIRDVIAEDLRNRKQLPPHRYEAFTIPTQPLQATREEDAFVGNFVYVDDFINMATQNPSRTRLLAITRASMHAIHEVFPPPDVTGHTEGKDPISLKKLQQGDARWETVKEVLGFLFDGAAKTVSLPPDKAANILKELERVLKKQMLPFKRFRSLLGKLRHVAIILPSLRGLFTPGNQILGQEPPRVSLSPTSPMRQMLKDMRALIQQLLIRPTHVRELVQGDDDALGYCDASAAGAGGVWFTVEGQPIVWRMQFPPDISEAVVSDDNPTGTITNSDLELAAVILHVAALLQVADPKHARLGILSDNSATVHWARRMASRSGSPISGYLLRGFAHLLRSASMGPITVAHEAGKDNHMADFSSRSFVSHPSSHTFLRKFSQDFPLPTLLAHQWDHQVPNTPIASLVKSALRGQLSPLRDWTLHREKPFGKTGSRSATSATSRRPLLRDTTMTPAVMSSWRLLSPSGQEVTADAVQSKLRPLKKRSASFAKNGNWTGDSLTPEKMATG
jgi:hypothetical protein